MTSISLINWVPVANLFGDFFCLVVCFFGLWVGFWLVSWLVDWMFFFFFVVQL